jgi:hypothetical protein
MAKNKFPERYAEELAIHALCVIMHEAGYDGLMLEHEGNKHVFMLSDGELKVWDADDLELSIPFESGKPFTFGGK